MAFALERRGDFQIVPFYFCQAVAPLLPSFPLLSASFPLLRCFAARRVTLGQGGSEAQCNEHHREIILRSYAGYACKQAPQLLVGEDIRNKSVQLPRDSIGKREGNGIAVC